MRAISIKTEYLKNPLGIDIKNPRIFWNCEDGKKQSAYQIVSDKWDSGKVETDSMHVSFPIEIAERESHSYSLQYRECTGP